MATIKTVQEESLVALGDAIRQKTGTNEALVFPAGMIKAIEGIETGGGSTELEPIVLTGVQPYGCAGAIAAITINLFPDKITTEGLTKTDYMFQNTTLERIPFALNYTGGSYYNVDAMFQNAVNLKSVPEINNLNTGNIPNFLNGCKSLREIPEGWADTWNLDRLHTYTYAYGQSFFKDCYSLRKVPSSFLKKLYNITTNSYSNCYGEMFDGCHNLDEVRGLIVSPATLTANVFSYTFRGNDCLKAFTFETNEDGTPKTANWKKQVIDLTTAGFRNISYSWYTRDEYCWNSGRTINDCIYDEATYEANKDNPNAFVATYSLTEEVHASHYSFYNHDSAVETINSLPDCSTYCGTDMNTIKFTGEAGVLTPGGAINTLSEEEIAVAAAKGWTVSLV